MASPTVAACSSPPTRRGPRRLQRLRPRRRGALRIRAAALVRRAARLGSRRVRPTTNCSPAPRLSATTTSNATSTSSGSTPTSRHRPAQLHRRGADRGGRADTAGDRAPGTGDLPGRDVRRPVRRIRRLPACSRTAAATGPRYRLRDTKLARSVKVEALLQLAAYAETLTDAGVPGGPRGRPGARRRHRGQLPASTNCCRSTARGGPRCSACSTSTWPAARPVAWADERVRACFRCAECDAAGPRARRPAARRRACGSASAPG